MILFNLLVFILFTSTYFIGQKIDVTWLQTIPGILLLYFLPGYNVNSILFYKRSIPWFMNLSLGIMSSITVLSLIYVVSRNSIGLDRSSLLLYVVVTNIVLAITATIVTIKNKRKAFFNFNRKFLTQIATISKTDKIKVTIISIPIIFLLIRLALNPYIFDIDSLVYFESYQKILMTGFDFGPLFSGREAFPFFMMSSKYIAGIGYTGFFKFFTPLIFILSSSILLGFQDNKKRSLSWAYLLILASPMLTIANESVRPETFSLAFTIPILVLCFLSIKNNDKLYLLLALFYSFVAFRFHESGFILLVSVLLTIFIILIKNYKTLYQLVKSNLLLAFLIALPYALLLKMNLTSLINFAKVGMTSRFLSFIQCGLSTIHWDWWFIDDCTTIMGAKIGWPGLSAILYYLYDGILLLFLAIILLIILLRIQKNKLDKKLFWLPLVPILFFFLLHFAYAELLPRIGIILLPNRSWPYIMLSLACFSIILIQEITTQKKYYKLIKFLSGVAIISGITGSIVGSTFMGAMVLPQEKTAINTLRNLPEDSIIVSTQRNNNLVRIYGSKSFLQIDALDFESVNFEQTAVDETITSAEQYKTEILASIIITKNSNKNSITINNKVIPGISEVEYLKNNDDKLAILQKYDPSTFNIISKQLNSMSNIKSKNIYFLYSFAKLDYGIINARPWWRESSDVNNYQFFKHYNKNGIVAADDNFIIIKVN